MQGAEFLIDWGRWCGKNSSNYKTKHDQKKKIYIYTHTHTHSLHFFGANMETKIAPLGKGADFSS